MSSPVMINNAQMIKVKRLIYQVGSSPRSTKLDRHELRKIDEIRKFFHRKKTLTYNQYKCFNHLCKKEGLRLDNSLDFILEE